MRRIQGKLNYGFGAVAVGVTLLAFVWRSRTRALDFEARDWVFAAIVILLALLPYVITARMSRASALYVKRWAVSVTFVYGIIDLALRTQALWFPASSTDGVVMITLPLLVAPAAFVLCALFAKVSVSLQS